MSENQSSNERKDASSSTPAAAQSSSSANANASAGAKPPAKKRRWLKIIGIGTGALAVVLIVGYLYLTSAHFVRHFILPSVGKSLGCQVVAGEISVHPFSSVLVGDLKVIGQGAPADAPPLFTCKRFEARYRLLSILRGAPQIEFVRIEAPQGTIVEYPDGKTSLDSVLAKLKAGKVSVSAEKAKPAKQAPAAATSATAPAINVAEITIHDAAMQMIGVDAKGVETSRKGITNFEFSLKDLRPGGDAKLAMSVKVIGKDPQKRLDVTNGEITLDATMGLGLDSSLKSLEANLVAGKFQGNAQDLAIDGYSAKGALSMILRGGVLELAPSTLIVNSKDAVGGSVRVSGQYDPRIGEGAFNFRVKDINRVFLNLLGASVPGGADFRNTSISMNYDVAIKNNHSRIEAAGGIEAKSFSVLTPEFASAPSEEMNLSLKQSVRYDAAKQSLEITDATIKANQKGRDILSGKLASPLTLDLSGAAEAGGAGPAIAYDFSINELDLAAYAGLARLPQGWRLNTGRLSVEAQALFAKKGADVSFNGKGTLSEFSGVVGGTSLPVLNLDFAIESRLAQMSRAMIQNAELAFIQRGQPAGKITASGEMDLKQSTGKFALTAKDVDQRALGPLIAAFAGAMRMQAGVINASETVQFSGRGANVNSSGQVSAAGLWLVNGDTGATLIPPLNLTLDHAFAMKDYQGKIEKMTLELAPRETSQKKETIALTGTVVFPKEFKATDNDPIKCALLVKSDRLTLDHYLPAPEAGASASQSAPGRPMTPGSAAPTAVPSSVGAAPSRPENASAKPQAELPALNLGWLQVEPFDARIAALNWQKLAINDMDVKASLKKSVLDLSKADMKMAEGTMKSSAKVNLNVPGWDYAVQAKIVQAQLGPVCDAFVPYLSGSVDGKGNVDVDVKGQGITPANLEKHLSGSVTATLADGKVERVPILDALGNVTKIPVLNQLFFFTGALDMKIADGKATIQKMDFTGKVERMGIRGWIGLDSSIDLSLQVALGGAYAREVNKIPMVGKLLADKDGFVALPMPVGMKGTLRNPKPVFKLTEVIREQGEKIIESVLEQGIEQGLNQLLDRQKDKKKDKNSKEPAKDEKSSKINLPNIKNDAQEIIKDLFAPRHKSKEEPASAATTDEVKTTSTVTKPAKTPDAKPKEKPAKPAR
ncbi:MAG: AsmA family protein [Candidatus Sumerlaeota bacterium]|nr:AsmA family protein [Candidatus Sumerlaeota bacterium]